MRFISKWSGSGQRLHGHRPGLPCCRRAGAVSTWPGLERLEARCLPTFIAPHSYSVGSDPRSVVAADLNGDARADLAVAYLGSNNVSILAAKANRSCLASE